MLGDPCCDGPLEARARRRPLCVVRERKAAEYRT